MRILFYVIGNQHRSNYLNGHTIRYDGASASGTDTSAILVAEHLSKSGHEVVFACQNSNPGETVRGVTYTNLAFDGIDNREFDILVSMLWVHDYKDIPVKIKKAVIYWSHMQWIYGMSELRSYAMEHDLQIGVVHISEWERGHNIDTVEMRTYNKEIFQTIIPNPVITDVVDEVLDLNLTRKPHKFTFHASWARGGRVAYDAVDALPWEDKEFHAFDYLMNIDINWGRGGKIEEGSFLRKHGGVDKITLFKHLAESEYFVYPLYTPYQDVHKDTFSCVVAEALALGCTVLTYPLGAVPEYFGDHCIWLDFPEGVDGEQLQSEPLSKDIEGKFIPVDKIVEKIKYLEDNPQIKEEIRENAKKYINSTFNIDRVGKMWDDFLEQLV
jgi:glycosyltransferase involved in cell wall biosynthesis